VTGICLRGAVSVTVDTKPMVGKMDRRIRHHRWSPRGWPPSARVGTAVAIVLVMLGLALRLISGAGVRTLRVPLQQVTIATVERGVFHDLIPLHASVVPRETVYVDATDGGQVNRVLVEPGDMVQAGQPCQPARKVDQLPASNIDQGGRVVEGSSVSDFI
jgi:hypothetical protein